MNNKIVYLLNFKRGDMKYNGFFYVEREKKIISNLKVNIYDIDELAMNPDREYMFIDNVMLIRQRDTLAAWEAQNMDSYSIQEINTDEYVICNDTQDVRIISYICVDKYSRMVTKRVDEYRDIHCLEMSHNRNKIYKFIDNKIYFTDKDNDCVETTWEKVFNIIDDKIEAFTIRDLSIEIPKIKEQVVTITQNPIPITIPTPITTPITTPIPTPITTPIPTPITIPITIPSVIPNRNTINTLNITKPVIVNPIQQQNNKKPVHYKLGNLYNQINKGMV